MNRFLKKLILLTFLLIIFGCSGDSEINNTDNKDGGNDHFSYILYGDLSNEIIAPIQKKLEDNYSRVLDDLGVQSMKKVTVKIWKNDSEFQNDMLKSIGVQFPGAGGWVYSSADIRVLYWGVTTSQNILHEFCHAVSLVLNSKFGNKPRWLWEAVAIYEANEFTHPKNISYLVNGDFPTIAELNSDFNTGNHKIYQVGYLLSEYIILSYGKKAYIDLIKSNGNIESTLGVTIKQFEENWKTFVCAKYF